jgi:hypothetical protein
MSDLKELSGLRVLDLSETAITYAGARELKHLKNLRLLDLRRTRVPDGGVRDLQNALPGLQIDY